MTTIAWDGKTLVGDSKSCAGGFPFPSRKVHRLSDGRLFGSSGSASEGEAVRLWLEDPSREKPKAKDFAGILIENGRCYRIEDDLVKFEVESNFHAIGSGRDFAIAAMHYGKTALEAVELASLYDIYTGGPFVELSPQTG